MSPNSITVNACVLYCRYITLNLQSEINPFGTVDSSCDEKAVYVGNICLNALTRWQQCFSPQSSIVYLPSDTNQEEAEDTAMSLLDLDPPLLSPECEAAIRPFLCLYLFGSCDSDNQPHRGTQASCERLRDDECAQEFLQTKVLRVLPNCDDLQQETECPGIRELTSFK